MAAGAKRFEFASANAIQDALGENASCRVACAEKQYIVVTFGHEIPPLIVPLVIVDADRMGYMHPVGVADRACLKEDHRRVPVGLCSSHR